MIGPALPAAGLLDRLALLRARLSRPATRFAALPDPGLIGVAERGRWLIAGQWLTAGRLVEAPGAAPWEVPGADAALLAHAHGFGWLDDLAALGGRGARTRAQHWTFRWIARFGQGRGPGWGPALAAQRLGRWMAHASFLLDGAGMREADLARAASRTMLYLAQRWPSASGPARIESLAAILRAGLALEGMAAHVAPAAQALGREAGAQIDPQGAIASRSPEDLAALFTLLAETAAALVAAGRPVAEGHRAAILRMAPVVRALRHGDGGLPRFHGGGRAFPERMDRALAGLSGPALPTEGLAMGFARLAAGRTTVIVDAEGPPPGGHAHASTLGVELSSGRRPLVVSCGSGRSWGPGWHRAGRATASHSTLMIEGFSSSRLARDGDDMAETARVLSAHLQKGPAGQHLHLLHDGWAQTHGLTHRRDLVLAPDGRSLSGADTLAALTAPERKRLDAALRAAKGHGLAFALRFHLHPDVSADILPDGHGVTLTLASGEVWAFRPEGPARLTLAPSVYLDRAHRLPRATRQIVLAGVLVDAEARIGWTFAKTEDTPLAIRDLARDDPPDRHGPDPT